MAASCYEEGPVTLGIIKCDSVFFRLRKMISSLVDVEDFRGRYSDMGRDCISTALVALILILRRLLGCSDRQMARAYYTDLKFKYALGLPVFYPGFHHSPLSWQRRRLAEHGGERRVFDRVFQFAIDEGLLSKTKAQVLDSTHIIGDVVLPSEEELIRHATINLLRAIERLLPPLASKISEDAGVKKHLNQIRKVGPSPNEPKEKSEHRMTAHEKESLFVQVVLEGRRLFPSCEKYPTDDVDADEAITLLARILKAIAQGDNDNVTRVPKKDRRTRYMLYTTLTQDMEEER